MTANKLNSVCLEDWLADTVFLVNGSPASRAAQRWAALLDQVPALQGARRVQGSSPAEAQQAVQEALAGPDLQGPDKRLVAVGGDGTFHLAGNALRGASNPPALGLIPAGTGGDLARNLGLARNPRLALHQLIDGQARPMDVMQVRFDGDQRWVMNDLSMGLSAQVVIRLGRTFQGRRAKSASSYITAALAEMMRYQPVSPSISLDGELQHEGPLLLAAVCNGRWFGNGLPVAPDAEVDDGSLDLVWAPAQARWRLPAMMLALTRGRHLHNRSVQHRRGTRVSIQSDPPQPLEVDGELYQASEVQLELRPGAIQVIQPPRSSHRPE